VDEYVLCFIFALLASVARMISVPQVSRNHRASSALKCSNKSVMLKSLAKALHIYICVWRIFILELCSLYVHTAH
jgi:hypothetical protein